MLVLYMLHAKFIRVTKHADLVQEEHSPSHWVVLGFSFYVFLNWTRRSRHTSPWDHSRNSERTQHLVPIFNLDIERYVLTRFQIHILNSIPDLLPYRKLKLLPHATFTRVRLTLTDTSRPRHSSPTCPQWFLCLCLPAQEKGQLLVIHHQYCWYSSQH